MNVIAEGVETADQLSWLRELSCPEAQGYWFSEPLSSIEAKALLEQKMLMLNNSNFHHTGV